MPKKILFICKGHQNIAGAQLYLKQIAGLFPEPDYELHYAFNFADGDRVFRHINKYHTIQLWEYDWRHLSFIESFGAAIRLLKAIKPDILIFNSNEDQIIAPLWAAYVLRIPKRVMAVHWAQTADGFSLFRKIEKFPFLLPSRYSFLTRGKRGISYAALTHIIFVNIMTRKAYQKLYKIKKSKTSTIYNGIDESLFILPDTVGQDIRRLLNVKAEECMILASGNLSEVKGHTILISAIQKLIENGLHVKCFIAGQGELYNSLKKQITDNRLSDFVVLLGYRNDIPELLAGTDIFCMPSLNEALGYSLLEAMAAGIPVVASRVGGIPEVITHTKEGLLVTPEDPDDLASAIAALAADSGLKAGMGMNGRKKVLQKFSIHRMLTNTKNFLSEGNI